MRLHPFVKKARREVLSRNGDICELFFGHPKTVRACHLFISWMRKGAHGRSRAELSQFAKDLQDGRIEKGFHYRRSSFYSVIRRRLLELGFLGLAIRSLDHGSVYKYILVLQPIPKRGPDGWSFARLCWILCREWNKMLESSETERGSWSLG